jgi:hypothetical protein
MQTIHQPHLDAINNPSSSSKKVALSYLKQFLLTASMQVLSNPFLLLFQTFLSLKFILQTNASNMKQKKYI